MSYANAAGQNIPAGEMPEPSQALRDGAPLLDAIDATTDAKIEADKQEAKDAVNKTADKAKKLGKDYEKKARAELDRAESAVEVYWEKAKDIVLRPTTLGGLVGVVNVGLLSTMGYWAYINKDRTWDQRQVGASIAGVLALFTAEGFVADAYLDTPEGQAEAERAKREGSRIYIQSKEVILRPGVAGGLLGAVNIAILGTVGYFAHKNWHQTWDRNTVLAIGAGLAALSGVEGILGQKYVDQELPKH